MADATGLGKTYMGLGLARALHHTPCAVVPAALRRQWRQTSDALGVPVELWTHEQLSRGRTPFARPTLVLVDEAHHFRNPRTRRYGTLARWVVGVPLLLVTATPIVNRTRDLIALLRLFLPEDALRAIGVPTLAALAERPAYLRAALTQVAVARGLREARAEGRLPRRRLTPPVSAPVLPHRLLVPIAEAVSSLEAPGDDHPRALLTLQLYRALASSVPAFLATVRRHARYLEQAIDAAAAGLALPRSAFRDLLRSGDPDQLSLLPLLLRPATKSAGAEAMRRDLARLARVTQLASHRPDPKADRLSLELGRRPSGAKALVFVNAVATARYLTRRLERSVALTGRGGWTPAGPIGEDDALRPFRPGEPAVRRYLDASVLVATDIAGEGLNLQAADLVVHYDLPWTPARLAQRVGRIRRLGSPHRQVTECAFLPHPLLAARILALERLLQKAWEGRFANPAGPSPVAALLGRTVSSARWVRRITAPGIVYRLHAGGYAAVGAIPQCVPAKTAVARLRRLLRRAALPAPTSRAIRQARRLLLSTAARAARERDATLLAGCDRALSRLGLGLTAGQLLLLEEALRRRTGRLRHLSAWLDRVGDRQLHPPRIELFVVAACDRP